MLQYPVFISAQHEDGRREQSNLKIVAASPNDAIELALQQYLPRFGGEDGWRIATVVDELRATAPDEKSGLNQPEFDD